MTNRSPVVPPTPKSPSLSWPLPREVAATGPTRRAHDGYSGPRRRPSPSVHRVKRLIGRSPITALAMIVVIGSVVVQWPAPPFPHRVPGHATDSHLQRHHRSTTAGGHHRGAGRRRVARARPEDLRRHGRRDGPLTPGVGVDFTAVARVPSIVPCLYAAGESAWLAGVLPTEQRRGEHDRRSAPTWRPRSIGCCGYYDEAARRSAERPNDLATCRGRPQQTISAASNSGATMVIGILAIDAVDLSLLSIIALLTTCAGIG